MNSKVLTGAVVVAVWYMIWDMFLFGPLLGPFLVEVEGMNPEPSLMWVAIGNLAAGLVLAWFYAKTGEVFGRGTLGGLKFGIAAGVLMGFPAWLFMSVFDTGWTYGASWAMTVANIAWVAVGGVLLGVVFEKMSGGAMTA
jgi:hypothetical protein